MAFIDQRLPTTVELNAQRTDEEDIDIVRTDGGYEVRNARSSQSLREFEVSFPAGKTDDATIAAVIDMYKAARGSLHSFRFRDFCDYQLTAEPIGVGDGVVTAFQIIQTWSAGALSHSRKITRPVASIQVFKDGVLQSSGYTVNYSTGIVTFDTAPGNGVAITVTGTFDIPVRFDTALPITALNVRLRHIDTLTIVELRE